MNYKEIRDEITERYKNEKGLWISVFDVIIEHIASIESRLEKLENNQK